VPQSLTDRERAVLDWIVAYQHGRRGLPTFREIGAAFDAAAPGAVRSSLLALERKGWLELTGRSRALQVLAVHGTDGPPESRAWLLARSQLERLAGELEQQGRACDAGAVRLAVKLAGEVAQSRAGNAELRERFDGVEGQSITRRERG
jgi:SOS-response transcriptional repressor LexA